jgi:hypothetical protein
MFIVNREITAKGYNNGDACAYRLETSVEILSYKMSTQHKLLPFPPIQRRHEGIEINGNVSSGQLLPSLIKRA